MTSCLVNSDVAAISERNKQIFDSLVDKLDFDIDYPKELKDNYLKIISNIYYHNTRKVYKDLKNKEGSAFEKGDAHQRELLRQKLAEEHLESTTKEVLDFFRVKGGEDFERKFLFECYSKDNEMLDETKLKQYKLDKQLEQTNRDIVSGQKYSCLLSDSHELAISKPIDVRV